MGTPTVIPSLRYKDAKAAVSWLEQAFGFTPKTVVPGPDDSVMHAELTWRGGAVMLGSVSDGSDGRLAVEQGPAWVYVVVEDVDAHHARAIAAGATPVRELEDMEYGSREYSVRDPEGNIWSFGTYAIDADA